MRRIAAATSPVEPDPSPRLAARATLLLAALIGLTALVTWPLAAKATTHLPMTHFIALTDVLVAGWLLAYQTHALLTAPLTIANANIFHPSPNGLFYGPMGFGALPLFAPVFAATSDTTLALNVEFLLGVALTAWTMSVVVLAWTGSMGAALVAACTLLGSEWLTRGMAATFPTAAAMFYLPPIIYIAACRTRTVRETLWLVPLIALQSLVDIVYVGTAVFAPLGTLVLLRLARRDARPAGLRLALALALSLVAMAPALAGYRAVGAANPHLTQQTLWTNHLILPLEIPSGLFSESSRAAPAFLFLFIAVMAIVSVRRMRHTAPAKQDTIWAHGLLWLLIGTLISLPPKGVIGGETIALPVGVLGRWIPALEVMRTHDRLGVAALMGIALLAGAATAQAERLLEGLHRQGAAWLKRGLVLALVIGLYVRSPHVDLAKGLWLRPFPLFEPPRWSPEAAAVLRATPGAVLELPVLPLADTKPLAHARAMFRSTQHWRPLINGHNSYYPSDYAARISLAAKVPDPDAIETLRREADLRMIAVPLDWVHPWIRRQWEALVLEPPPRLRLVYRSRNELLFAVDDAVGTDGGSARSPLTPAISSRGTE